MTRTASCSVAFALENRNTKPLASSIGRKNWLAGHDAAAENHARQWSLIASAERHGLDPQRYLTSVLSKIGTTSISELDQFLPDVWNRDDAEEPMASG